MSDIKELSSFLQFKEVPQFEKAVTYGEVGNEFFLILKGLVSIQIPNPAVPEWKIKWRDYQKLLDWKKSTFDPRAAQGYS